MLAAMPLGLGFAPGVLDIDKADEASREAAEQIAAEGDELARQAGFNAEWRACKQLAPAAGAIAPLGGMSLQPVTGYSATIGETLMPGACPTP
jgi:hypothetical protein